MLYQVSLKKIFISRRNKFWIGKFYHHNFYYLGMCAEVAEQPSSFTESGFPCTSTTAGKETTSLGSIIGIHYDHPISNRHLLSPHGCGRGDNYWASNLCTRHLACILSNPYDITARYYYSNFIDEETKAQRKGNTGDRTTVGRPDSTVSLSQYSAILSRSQNNTPPSIIPFYSHASGINKIRTL